MSSDNSAKLAGDVFVTTHWSVVLRAGGSDSTTARDALAALCQTYWRPLYSYVRSRGHQPADAEDLTQAFFVRLLERKDVTTVNPERGRFRSYLLAAMNRFLCANSLNLGARCGSGCMIWRPN